jgi:AcrR family transcriptional regulator
MEAISTEEKIKKAALREFGLYGFEGARVDRIAQKAKINKAMIYYHYKGKENLYEAVLSDAIKAVFFVLTGSISNNKSPDEQLESMISEFIDFIKKVDQDFVKMMLRELSSGGRYFKKLMLPGVIVPVMKIVQEIISSGIKQGIFREILPQYSFLQTVGAIVFFNAIRITLQDTDVGKSLFPEDAFDKFKKNLLGILKTGIMVH